MLYRDSTASVTVNLSDTGRETGGFAAFDTLISIENVVGSTFGDTICGTGAANAFHGYDGNDVIFGNGGSDKIYGGNGNDLLSGSAAAGQHVLLNGGIGQDRLKFSAGGGNAEITTGSGNDRVIVDIRSSEDFRVVITDFEPYWEAFDQTVTAQEALAGDQLVITFPSWFGTNLDAMSAHTVEQIGNDLIMRFDNDLVNGDIVFENIGDHIDLVGGFRFFFDAQIYHEYTAV